MSLQLKNKYTIETKKEKKSTEAEINRKQENGI